MSKLVIRKMDMDDLNAVHYVERSSFSEPWPKEIFYEEMVRNKHAHYHVIELDNEIIGYAGLWVVADDAQITNIAINPAYRGNKYGERLFYFVLQYAISIGAKQLSLEVRVSNTVAQRMYRKFGLVPGGIRKNYYRDNQEDAIVMWVKL